MMMMMIQLMMIFQPGYYASIIGPDSSAGYLEIEVGNEIRRVAAGRNQVLTIGDSRMGFFPRYTDQQQPTTGYTFATIATAGTTARCWYYMLRDVDPTARRYAAIVIGVNDYEDAETWDDTADYITDLHYLIARLRWSDLVEFSSSFDDPQLKWQAARGILLKGLVYKTDFQDFLRNPVKRLRYVELSRRKSATWYYDYEATKDSVKGITMDWAAKTVQAPPNFTAAQVAEFQKHFLVELAPQTGRRGRFAKKWYGKIADRYRGSGTRLIFVRLPRGPFVRPDQPAFNPHSSMRELAARGDAILDQEHSFDPLERPELFLDPYHMNGPGCSEFSQMVARECPADPGAASRGALEMLFNTLSFFVFFGVVLALFYFSPRPWRKWILLAASYYFYMSWNAKFVALLLTLTAVDFTAALWIERTGPRRRKLFLTIGLAANLGFLGFFKYYNFLGDNPGAASAAGPAFLRLVDHPAPRHQFSHVSKHVLPGGCVSWSTEGDSESHRLRALHRFFPATGGRTDCAGPGIFQRLLFVARAGSK